MEGVLQRLPVIDFDTAVARSHARVWAALEAAGKVIGPHDTLIAATALEHDHSLATLNVVEFSNVPALRLENITAFVIAKR